MGLQRGGQIAAVMGERAVLDTDARLPQGTFRLDAEAVLTAEVAQAPAQRDQFGKPLRLANLREHRSILRGREPARRPFSARRAR